MSAFNIEVESGKSVKLPTAGKYCDRDIVVTATEGSGAYDDGFADGKEQGKQIIADCFDSWYYLFSVNHRMELLSRLLELDLSHVTNTQYAFLDNTALTEFHAPPSMNNIQLPHYMFSGCTNLVRVSGLDKAIKKTVVWTGVFEKCEKLVDAGTLNFQETEYATRIFQNCYALEEVRFTGNINLSVSFAQSSKLSADSIQSIIDHLADRTGTSALTLTLHATVGGKLTDAQKATATAKNWTLAY